MRAILSLMMPKSPMFRADVPAERAALGDALDREPEQRLANADATRREAEAARVQDLHRHLEPFADLADDVGVRDADVFEEELGRGRAADAELVLVRAVLHAHAALDEERRDLRLRALFERARASEDGEQIGKSAVRDPDLRPVEHVPRAVRERLGARLDRGRIGARGGLGEREGGDVFTRRELREILLLLRRRAEEQERLQADRLVRAERDRDRRVDPADLLHHPRVRRRREADAAVFGRDL
jgi:hypothetical protein